MMTAPALLQLQSGPLGAQLCCTIRPDLGASIQSLVYRGLAGDVPVLRVPPAAMQTVRQTVREMGCFPLVPFSNRVAKAKLQWNGTDHPLVKMGTTEEHAMHGVAWQRPWEVLEASDDFAMLSYEHKADSAWPFAFDVSQIFKLSGSTLTMTLSVTNQAPSPAPIGLGWHPYFAKRAGAHLSFHATSRWEMGSDKLPTALKTASGLFAACADLDVDHGFEGWSGVATLADERLTTRIESNLPRLIAYTHPSKTFVAIEPVSHASNAINQANAQSLGVQVLQSGETFTAQMTMSVSPNKSFNQPGL